MYVPTFACIYTDGLQCVLVDVIVLSYVIFCFFGGDVCVYLGAYFCVHECVRCWSGRVCPLFIDCKEVLSVSVRAAE